ncbi:MAG: ChbG/HpnK family deacetylase [Acidobacteria bacterium]|nr:ChbG/HpnK family deacetylase [Acidobacteriota bacterium]
MAQLIVNADDFGLTPGVNRAIAELHAAGALSSATLMACGDAFEDAVRIAQAQPTLGVGCHIVLIDGRPTAPASEVRSLLGPHSQTDFHTSLPRFVAALHSGRIRAEEIELETTAQIRHLQSHGIRVTHVDTHKHTHLFPAVAGPLLRAAQACGVPAIRNPFEPAWCSALAGGFVRRTQVAMLRTFENSFRNQPLIASGSVRTTQGSIGVSATGMLDAAVVKKLCRTLPEGIWELVTHPGYNDAALAQIKTRLRATRDIERDALLAYIPHCGSQIISFADLRNR